MKWLLFGWGLPVGFICLWYGLSYYDLSFGIFLFTRKTHDMVFEIYGKILGMPPEVLPPLVFRAIVVDSLIVFGLYALKRRKDIMAWWRARQLKSSSELRDSADSLSSAP